MEQARNQHLEIHGAVVVSTPSANQALHSFIQQIAPVGYSLGFVFPVHLATEVALDNAANHGNRNNPAKNITLTWRADRLGVRVEIEDEGDGFDPEDVPDPLAEESRLPCGRGLLLIRSLMDEVQFNERGNRITMVKHCGSSNGFDHSQAPHSGRKFQLDAPALLILD